MFLVRVFNHFKSKRQKKKMLSCGKNVSIQQPFNVVSFKNLIMGDNCYIAPGVRFINSRAKIILGNNVLIGGDSKFISGNHRIDIPGLYMSEVTDDYKNEEYDKYDKDIIVEDDVMFGVNCLVLSGVHIGTGSFIGAGSIVNKDIPPYSIAVGVPAKVIKQRFTSEQLDEHLKILKNRGLLRDNISK